MTTLTAPLVGMRHHEGAAEALSELGFGDELILKREPENAFDENAIQVFAAIDKGVETQRILLGYIAREFAAEWAPVFDEHGVPEAHLTFSSEGRPRVEIEVEDDDQEGETDPLEEEPRDALQSSEGGQV